MESGISLKAKGIILIKVSSSPWTIRLTIHQILVLYPWDYQDDRDIHCVSFDRILKKLQQSELLSVFK